MLTLRSLSKYCFCFKYRRQWQNIFKIPQQTIHSFIEQTSRIQKKLIPAQKYQLFNLADDKSKNKYIRKLYQESPVPTTLVNNPINWHIFQFKNKQLEQRLLKQQFQLQLLSKQTHDISLYFDQYLQIIKEFLQNKIFANKIKRRFVLLQQAFSRLVIENYAEIKQGDIFDISKTKFKEDVKYVIRDIKQQQLKTLAQVIKVFGDFNVISKKMSIIIQLLLQKYHKVMNDEIWKFLFVLAHSKSGMKKIESDIIERIEGINKKSQFINCLYALYYVIINQTDNYTVVSHIILTMNSLSFQTESLNINELRIIYLISKWLVCCPQKYPLLLINQSQANQIENKIKIFYSEPSSEEQFFKRFITKQEFKYKTKTDQIFMKTAYIMSNNVVFFMDLRDLGMNNQDTGLLIIGKDYYKHEGIKIKMINASQTNRAQTRRKQVQYFWSKLKKQERAVQSQKPLHYQY